MRPCIFCTLEKRVKKKLGDAVHAGEMDSGGSLVQLLLHKMVTCPVSVAKELRLVNQQHTRNTAEHTNLISRASVFISYI